MKHALSLFLLLASASVHAAITPETGLWWNPDEPGRGFSIEVQNETLVLTVYVYTPAGEPVFYQGVGTLQLQGQFVEGELARKSNGQCITCEYRKPETEVDFAGPFEIEFTSETTGVLTWKGGDVPIQRFEFGWGTEWTKMLGEWQLVLDYSSVASQVDFLYYGDILVFDHTDTVNGQLQFEGFRRDSEFDRTGEGLGHAAGAYVPQSGLHVIVVSDDPDHFIGYFIEVGTRQFEGMFEEWDKCSDEELDEPRCNPDGEGIPVHGFRTAGRTEVQTKSARVESSVKAVTSGGLQVPLEARFGRASGDTVSLKSVTGKSVDPQVLQETVRRLMESLAEPTKR